MVSKISSPLTLFYITAGVVTILFSFVLSNPYPWLNKYYGRVASKDHRDRYLNHGGLNNDHCWLNTGNQMTLHSIIGPDGYSSDYFKMVKVVKMSRYTLYPGQLS